MLDSGSIGSIMAAAVSLTGGAVLWLRQNKIANSRANLEVAANFADTAVHRGQAEELKALRERVTSLDTAFVHTASRLAVLEAAHIGANAHFENLDLCEPCQENNAAILAAMARAFAQSTRGYRRHSEDEDDT